MAYTPLEVSDGMAFSNSLYGEGCAKIVLKIMERAKALNLEIILPEDFVVSIKVRRGR